MIEYTNNSTIPQHPYFLSLKVPHSPFLMLAIGENTVYGTLY